MDTTNIRHSLLSHISREKSTLRASHPPTPQRVPEYFGEHVLSYEYIKEKLPEDAFQSFERSIFEGEKIPDDVLLSLSKVIKDWGISKGATHFCHWFQPMTGLTAEKHDAFITFDFSSSSFSRLQPEIIEKLSPSQLIQGEPDASSFPSGGMRSTFEARGYTAWDPSSPIFLIEGIYGNKTLCIPSVFFGYHGDALDHKTPLLRAAESLGQAVVEFLSKTKLLGKAKKVFSTLGPEQEYFLIDRRFLALRPDIYLTGRTLLGASSPKGQEFEDHYFGSIPQRVQAFMEDLEYQLYRLGIPVKTRHNEVAPSQYEFAPIFEPIHIAADHNTLAMDIMKKTALDHDFVCLLHEKPFQGINGSGKHCNFSMSTDLGENLLEPGKTPHENLRFLLVMSTVVKSVHDHAGMIRASIASAGNDLRLGANEAPPAIISVFLGSFLEKILDSILKGEIMKGTEQEIINLGVSHLPTIAKDYTDRNRTSPFAFTGNKFEFRAVGSSANVAVPMTFLMAALTDGFREASRLYDDLISKKEPHEKCIIDLLKILIEKGKPIRFEGNNYSKEWENEASHRGLPHLKNTPDALQVFEDPKVIQCLTQYKILSEGEIKARLHIQTELYVKTKELEIKTLLELVEQSVLPSLEKEILVADKLMQALSHTTKTGAVSGKTNIYERKRDGLTNLYTDILTLFYKLEEKFLALGGHETTQKVHGIKALHDDISGLQKLSDKAEKMMADDLWPLPKYREMLFASSFTR